MWFGYQYRGYIAKPNKLSVKMLIERSYRYRVNHELTLSPKS